MRTIDALGSNTRRHSYGDGAGVDLAEFGKLRSLAAGGEGVGSELRPFIAIPPACMLAKDRFVPVVTEAMACVFRCGMRSRGFGAGHGVGAVLTQLPRWCLGESRDGGIRLFPLASYCVFPSFPHLQLS
jgi:hypothetical protein